MVDKKIEKLTLNVPTHFFISRLRQNLEILSDRNLELIKKLKHEPTKTAADAERALLIALGGGCNMPIAAYAQATETEITIEGDYATDDGKHFEKGTVTGSIDDKKTLARTLALQLKAKVTEKQKAVLSDATTS